MRIGTSKAIHPNGADMRRRMKRTGVSGVDRRDKKARSPKASDTHALQGRRLQASTFRTIAMATGHIGNPFRLTRGISTQQRQEPATVPHSASCDFGMCVSGYWMGCSWR